MFKSGFQSVLVLAGILFWLSPHAMAEDSSIRWFEDFEAGVNHATTHQLPLMLHFYGESCPPCKMLEKRAFKNPELVGKINRQMVAIKINGDREKDLRERYRITSWPTDVYLTPTGKELYRTTSPQDAAVFAQLVDRVALQCADWNVEQMAARKAEERRLAKRTSTQLMQAGQSSIDPNMTGPVVHPVVTQSRVNGLPPTTKQSPSDAKQRRIENPYIAENPLVVPAAQPSALPNQSPANARTPVANRSVPVQQIATAMHPNSRPAAQTQAVNERAMMDRVVASNASAPNLSGAPNGSAVPNAPAVPVQPQPESTLPPANGLDGFCPVTLVMAVRSNSPDCWAEGRPEFAVRHRGRIYFCASDEARKTFLTAPDDFAPALSNYDLIHFVKTGELIDGRCEFGSFQPTTGRVFLFANKQNCMEFQQMEAHYSELLHRGMSPERVAEQPQPSQVR